MKDKIRKTRRFLNWIILPAVLFGAVTLYYVNSSPSAQLPNTFTSTKKFEAPRFTLFDIDGRSISLSDYAGKVVILDFWAPWCPPCKREIPDFISLQSKYASRGLQIIGVGLDQMENVTSFVRQNGINYPVVLGDDEVTNLYGGISGIPTTFIIDKEGNINNKFVGFTSQVVFEEAIKKLL